MGPLNTRIIATNGIHFKPEGKFTIKINVPAAFTIIGSYVNGKQQINNTSIADELEKIYELKRKGILTEDEFNNLKSKILRS